MRISVPVTPKMMRELRAIRKGLEVDSGDSWTLPEVYSRVMEDGIVTRASGFYSVSDDDPAYLAYLKALDA